MTTESDNKPTESPKRHSLLALFRNWVSLSGLVIAGGSCFAFVLLFGISLFAPSGNPYMGILVYLVAPGFLFIGLFLVILGFLLQRRALKKSGTGVHPPLLRIDLSLPRHRRGMAIFVGASVLFILLTAFGSYQTYHYTESVQFCGQVCHTVMEPEHTAYQNSPHARVTCAQCHIGSGADWYVKSKLSGAYQVYAALANKYPRPIPTPVENLRPAQQTCEQCHWPQKFYGSAVRVNHHYLSDDTNTPWTIHLLMKIGGGDPEHGPVGGIHWHMNIANKVEYIHTDRQRMEIPWVRMTYPDGRQVIFEDTEKPLTPEQVAAATPRRMDCIDCHNRPTHIYRSPNRAVNMAMSTGRIDSQIPFIKKQAVELLAAEYATADEAVATIADSLKAFYEKDHAEFLVKNRPQVERAIAEVQKIYTNNFFPEMKADWRVYPDHIGHSTAIGCFRCHDGKHVATDAATGKTLTITRDCNSCHSIIAQGSEAELKTVQTVGMEFQHPVDIGDMWKEMNCHECHNGGPAQ